MCVIIHLDRRLSCHITRKGLVKRRCFPQRLACPDKCVLDKKNLLGETGVPDVDAVEALFEGLPEAHEAVLTCFNGVKEWRNRQIRRYVSKCEQSDFISIPIPLLDCPKIAIHQWTVSIYTS